MPVYFIIYVVLMLGLELACAIVGCWLVRKYWARPYKVLVALAALSSVVECLSGILNYVKIDSRITYVWFTPLETWVVLYFLGATQSKKLLRLLPFLFAISMLILQPMNFMLPYPRNVYFQNMYLQVYFCFLMLLASCGVLIGIIQNADDSPIFSIPPFWMAAGMLGYSSTYMVLSLLGGALASYVSYAAMSTVANTCMYSGMIVCFVKYARIQRKLVKPV